jgi:hypothetical protein
MRAAGNLTMNGWASDSEPDYETFGVLLLDSFGFTGRFRVKEESSVPHARLSCIHLQASSTHVIDEQADTVTADPERVKKKSASRGGFPRRDHGGILCERECR